MKKMKESEARLAPDFPEETMLPEIVESLCQANNGLTRLEPAPGWKRSLPSRAALIEVVEWMRSLLFPGYFGATDLTEESVRFHVGVSLDEVRRALEEQIKRAFCFVCKEEDPSRCPECEERVSSAARSFLAQLPKVRRMLSKDVQAAYIGDPAATSPEETILCYPGILAVTSYRLAHELYRLQVPLLPRIITEHAHSITGIDIHPGATIGESFFIDHGTGVVIGETSVIGNRVRIYQGVTLGAKSFPLDEQGNPIKGIPRHPVVEDDVVIYGGATILGRVTVGRGSVIGGNVWLTHSVPPATKITQAKSVRNELFFEGDGI